MSFKEDEDYPISFWANEVVEIISKVEGIPKKDARLRFMECLGDYIGYYEIGLKASSAVDRVWMEGKK